MFGSNDLLLQGLLSSTQAHPIRSQTQQPFLHWLPSLSELEMMAQPNLNQIFLNRLIGSAANVQQLHDRIQFQLLLQQPEFLNVLSNLTGAKTTEVPDERHEKLHEKVSPVTSIAQSIALQSRKRTASSSPTHQIVTKKSKALRKLHNADAETNSPVSGMFIKEASDVTDDDLSKAYELDETAACVEITEESKRKIAEIPNVIGKSKCSLCKRIFTDVFRLAMHRCPRIVHAEYKCPECDKTFSCPANLASHQRWHQPRNSVSTCDGCFQQFDTKKAYREHKCLQKLGANGSSRNSISSTVNASSPSLADSSTSGSPSEISSIHLHSPQPALISLGLNTKSLQLHAHLGLKFES